jgi:hypothetical protein
MMYALAQLVVWVNMATNALGSVIFAPIAVLPGWLSAVLISAVVGLLLLVIFKYTSPQRSIKAIRNDTKANLLALKLFKESASVTLQAQGRILLGSALSVLLAIGPVLIMLIPVSLIWGQLSLWYQPRPLRPGEQTVLTLKLKADSDVPLAAASTAGLATSPLGQGPILAASALIPRKAMPDVRLESTRAVEVTIGPVRSLSKREVFWKIKALEPGYHHLVFQVDGQTVDKELAIGDGYMRVSMQRPGWYLTDVLENPAEQPFSPDSTVQWIEVDYPKRSWWTSSMIAWFIYWFVAALCLRRFVNVSF